MTRLLVYYAHPGHKYSRVNVQLANIARQLEGISFCDLYELYPRFDININQEQERLLNHDVILFQHPLFWYSTPSLIKEWIDLVLEHGFAFGDGGKKLEGKVFMNALTASAPSSAYSLEGYQQYPLRTFLTPLEQTARLCHMQYAAPYVLYSAIKASEENEIAQHVKGYKNMLEAIRDDRFNFERSLQTDIITFKNIKEFIEVPS